MTTYLFFFWRGLGTASTTIEGIPCLVAGQVFVSGIQRGGVFVPGIQRGDVICED